MALCFDLTLRLEGKTTLDDVMRALWTRCHSEPHQQRHGAGAMSERDFATVLEELGGRSFTQEIAAWIHGTQELPVEALLVKHGVTVANDPTQLQQRLGLRVVESKGIDIKTVLRGGTAEQAGFAAGDEWLGLEVPASKTYPAQHWRLMVLDDVTLYAGTQTQVTAMVARDKRLLKLPLNLATPAAASTTWRLTVQDAKRVSAWLCL